MICCYQCSILNRREAVHSPCIKIKNGGPGNIGVNGMWRYNGAPYRFQPMAAAYSVRNFYYRMPT